MGKRARTARATTEEGFTLVEVLVTASMMTVVLAALLGLYSVSASEQQRVDGRVRGLIGQRNGLESMSRELRQATMICRAWPTCDAFSSSSTLDFQRLALAGSAPYWVRYDCSGTPPQPVPPGLSTRACLRSQASSPAQLGADQRIVVGNLSAQSTGIFSFTGTSYVTISLQVVARGAKNPISLDDGIRLRNANDVPDSGEQG
jgi:type II secretory pathway pseudopilin PulG